MDQWLQDGDFLPAGRHGVQPHQSADSPNRWNSNMFAFSQLQVKNDPTSRYRPPPPTARAPEHQREGAGTPERGEAARGTRHLPKGQRTRQTEPDSLQPVRNDPATRRRPPPPTARVPEHQREEAGTPERGEAARGTRHLPQGQRTIQTAVDSLQLVRNDPATRRRPPPPKRQWEGASIPEERSGERRESSSPEGQRRRRTAPDRLPTGREQARARPDSDARKASVTSSTDSAFGHDGVDHGRQPLRPVVLRGRRKPGTRFDQEMRGQPRSACCTIL